MTKYLFATDGSEESSSALEFLENQVHPGDSVVVLYVMPNVEAGMLEEYYDSVVAEQGFREMGEELLNGVADRLSGTDATVETDLRMGKSGPVIVDQAGERDVDVIVMGRRGKGAVSDLLLGSVSQYVLHHASCPVTIVPL